MTLQDHIARFKKYSHPASTQKKVMATEKIPSFQNNRKLRDYQLEGFKWMVLRYEQGLGCILGDEVRYERGFPNRETDGQDSDVFIGFREWML